MKTYVWMVVLVVAAMALSPETAVALTRSESDNAPAASGAGLYSVSTHTTFFIFFARATETGNATGRLILQQMPYLYDSNIKCLVVIGGDAFMSGYVTRSNDPLVPPGSSVDFGVRDNDTSAGRVDLISQIDFRFNAVCASFHEQPIHPLDRGMIEVRRSDPGTSAID